MGVRRGFVVYGRDRMDEISLSAETCVCELKDGYYRTSTIKPEDFGLERCEKADLIGATPAENAETVRAIFAGAEGGPKRDAALLNAAFALVAAGVVTEVAEGIEVARQTIDDGSATKTLDAFVAVSNR